MADLDNTVHWDKQTFGVVLNALDKEDREVYWKKGIQKFEGLGSQVLGFRVLGLGFRL